MVLTALALAVLPQTQVHVVDAAAGPGSTHTTLAGALASAGDGDVVLVRAGDYLEVLGFPDGVNLLGRGLTVVAEAGATVRTGFANVEELPPTSQVLVQGLTFQAPVVTGDFVDDLGPIWLERCSFEPGLDLSAGGLIPRSCASIVLVRSEVHPVNFLVPGHAVLADASRLHVHGSLVTGRADGGTSAAFVARDASFVELFGSSVLGGDGAPGNGLFCDGQPGQDAFSLQTASTLVSKGSLLQGGAGGPPFQAGCSAGPDGEDLVVAESTVVPLGGTARALELSSPVREGALVQATFTGEPGDQVWLFYSERPAPGVSSRAVEGELLLAAPRFLAFTAQVPASGTLVVSGTAPDLAPGDEAMVLYCHALFRGAGGGFLASSPGGLVVLDASL